MSIPEVLQNSLVSEQNKSQVSKDTCNSPWRLQIGSSQDIQMKEVLSNSQREEYYLSEN